VTCQCCFLSVDLVRHRSHVGKTKKRMDSRSFPNILLTHFTNAATPNDHGRPRIDTAILLPTVSASLGQRRTD
jgi:hypothetical protein